MATSSASLVGPETALLPVDDPAQRNPRRGKPRDGLYIKQIKLRGFRQYGEETRFPVPLSARNTLILGINGSGKSNLLHAILFVISDHYEHLTPEQRKQFIYSGPAAKEGVSQAFVELTFGFATDAGEKEWFISRAVSANMDTYMLNGTPTSRSQIRDVMVHAGLNLKYNPFYFIQQNKVQDVARMTPKANLEMLEKYSGAIELDARIKSADLQIKKHDATIMNVHAKLNAIANHKSRLWEEHQRALQFSELERQAGSYEQELARRDLVRLEAHHEEMKHDLVRHQESMTTVGEKVKSREQAVVTTQATIVEYKNALAQLDYVRSEEYLIFEDTFREKLETATLDRDCALKIVSSGSRTALQKKKEQIEMDMKQCLTQLSEEEAPNPIRIRDKLEATEAQKGLVLQKLARDDVKAIKAALERRKVLLRDAKEKRRVMQQNMAALEAEKAAISNVNSDPAEKELVKHVNTHTRESAELQKAVENATEVLRSLAGEKRALQKALDEKKDQLTACRAGLWRSTPLRVRNALRRIKEEFNQKYDIHVVLNAIHVKQVYRAAVEICRGKPIISRRRRRRRSRRRYPHGSESRKMGPGGNVPAQADAKREHQK